MSAKRPFYCDDIYGIPSEGDLFEYVHSEGTRGSCHLPIECEQVGFTALSDCNVERARSP
jgi:hypothetical protein